MKTWDEVSNSDAFGNLTINEQETARQQYFSQVVAPKAPPDKINDVRAQFDAQTKDTGVDDLMKAIGSRESSDNPNAVGVPTSQGRAMGSMQITRPAFDRYAQAGESFDNDTHRRSAARRMIADDYNYFGGDARLTAAAYIGGRGAVDNDGNIRNVADPLGTKASDYADQVLARIDKNGHALPDAYYAKADTSAPLKPTGPDQNPDEMAKLQRQSNQADKQGEDTAQYDQMGNLVSGSIGSAKDTSSKDIGLVESAMRGFSQAGAGTIKTLGLAVAAPVVLLTTIRNAITGSDDTSSQDAVFKHFVDPAQNTIDWATIKPDERQDITSKVSSGIASMAADLPIMILGGYQAAAKKGIVALSEVVPSKLKYLEDTLHTGFDAMRGIMVKTGTEKFESIKNAGGTTAEAIAGASTAAMWAGATGSAAMSLEGSVMRRLATGVPVGAVLTETGRQVQNASMPDSMQTKFDIGDLAAGSLTNAVMAGAMGHKAPEPMFARPGDLVRPETSSRVDPIEKSTVTDQPTYDPTTPAGQMQALLDLKTKTTTAAAADPTRQAEAITSTPDVASAIKAAEETANVDLPTEAQEPKSLDDRVGDLYKEADALKANNPSSNINDQTPLQRAIYNVTDGYRNRENLMDAVQWATANNRPDIIQVALDTAASAAKRSAKAAPGLPEGHPNYEKAKDALQQSAVDDQQFSDQIKRFAKSLGHGPEVAPSDRPSAAQQTADLLARAKGDADKRAASEITLPDNTVVHSLSREDLPVPGPGDRGLTQGDHDIMTAHDELMGTKHTIVDNLPGGDGMTTGADGTVYIKASSRINPIDVHAHEVNHVVSLALGRDSPAIQAEREATLSTLTPEGKGRYALYYGDAGSKAEIDSILTPQQKEMLKANQPLVTSKNKAGDWTVDLKLTPEQTTKLANVFDNAKVDHTEELVSDLRAHAINEPGYWSTFRENLAQRVGEDKAASVYQKLMTGLQTLIQHYQRVFDTKPSFKVRDLITNHQEVYNAIARADAEHVANLNAGEAVAADGSQLPLYSTGRGNTPRVVIKAEGKAPTDENRLGLIPKLRTIAPSAEVFTSAKGTPIPLITQSTNNNNAIGNLEGLTRLLDLHKTPEASVGAWNKMAATAFGTTDVPIPPYQFLASIKDASATYGKMLGALSEGQNRDADHGFANAKEFRRLYLSGQADVQTTGKLLLWSFLSRGVSPYTQEGLFIDAVKGAGPYIKLAAEGKFDEAALEKYSAWTQSVAPESTPGRGAQHNLNAFGRDFLTKMGRPDENGVTSLQRFHDMMTNPALSGNEVRREFQKFGEGVGIDNKVVSFTMLVAGYEDVMVLDRVQIKGLWNDGRFDGYNLYDGAKRPKADGKGSEPIPGSGLADLTSGVRGLVYYEAMERAIARKLPAIYEAAGRPQDASIGRFHWDTWVSYSGQEASHGTLDAILNDAAGRANPYDNVTAKEGEYGGYNYGMQYGKDAGGSYFVYADSSGKKYEFSVEDRRQMYEAMTDPKNGVVPKKDFRVSKDAEGNDRTAPWYEDPRVDREKLDGLIQRFGDPASGGRAVREHGEGASTDGTGFSADATRTSILSKYRESAVRPRGRAEGKAEETVPAPYRRGAGQRDVVINGESVKARTWSPDTAAGNVFRSLKHSTPDFQEISGPNAGSAFEQAIQHSKDGSKFGAAVNVYPAEEYSAMKMFITADGKTGFAVKPDGDIVSVFNTGRNNPKVVQTAMHLAVQAGGRKLDAFDTVLPDLYADAGFRVTSRMKFSDEYAPEGWDHDTFKAYNSGKPDVVFMAYDRKRDTPYEPGEGPITDDYDKAVASQVPKFSTDRGSRTQEDTPEFKKFFDGSKVVDEEGKPLVVYHGTNKEISEFQKRGGAIYLTSSARYAEKYANGASRGAIRTSDVKQDANILPVYASIKNPYITNKGTEAHFLTEDKVNQLIADGYDGVLYSATYGMKGVRDGDATKASEVIVFNPEQIKSAIGNDGSFDSTNPDIRRSTPRTDPAQVESRLSKILGVPKEFLKSPLGMTGRIGTAIVPMSMGSESGQVAATRFADQARFSRLQWNRFDEIIKKNFTPERQEAMWNAADRENDIRREMAADPKMTRPDGEGLDSLDPKERDVVDVLHQYGETLLERARDAGMYEGEGVPFWTPRMVMLVDGEGGLHLPGSGGEGGGSKDARNLRTNSNSLKQRKYLTSAETEAAAQSMNEDDKTATIVRNIRTMPMAMARLEAAISGRELVNQIKAIGTLSGADVMAEGKEGDKNYFTMDHPALRRTRPEMVENADGKMVPRMDTDGNIVMQRTPIYISKEFEGPLRAVLNRESLPGYQSLMNLKSKSMGLIMMSPLIHMAVEYGRSVPAMVTSVGGKDAAKNIATMGAYTYFVGNKAKQDMGIMHDAVSHGLVPIGGRGQNVDIQGIADASDMKVGKSWTAQLLGRGVDLINKDAGQATRAGVDALGKFVHETLLWDRIADLQMGLFVTMKSGLVNKGIDDNTAATLAAHWANRYAGALPAEAMGQYAREVANATMFSRSFTLGNLGLMKDMFNGIPPNRQAMVRAQAIEAMKAIGMTHEEAGDVGADVLKQAKSTARTKAVMTVALDIALSYAANALLQDFLQRMRGDKTWAQQVDAYKDRMGKLGDKLMHDPLSVLQHPFESMESLTPQGHNPEGKRDRVYFGEDKEGNTIYVRFPFGKVGEELVKYLTPSTAATMAASKLSPQLSGAYQAFNNADHFGHKVYGEHDAMPVQVGKAVWHFMKAQTPYDQGKSAVNVATGNSDEMDYLKAFGPYSGLTFSKVTGGDLKAQVFKAQRDFMDRQIMVMPDVKDAIKAGKQDKAVDMLLEIGMSPKEANSAVNRIENPGRPMSPSSIRKMHGHATEDQKESIDEIRNR